MAQNKCLSCHRYVGEDAGDCFGGPGSTDCLRAQLNQRDEKLARVMQLFNQMRDEEARYHNAVKTASEFRPAPSTGDHHASMHRGHFIRSLFYALYGHMP